MKQRTIQFRAINEHGAFYYWTIDQEMDLSLIKGDTITQFTGLKDKNGKEIYEGDMFKRANEHSVGFHYCVVIFENACFKLEPINYSAAFYGHDLNQFNKNYEIIGNIFENPELIKKN